MLAKGRFLKALPPFGGPCWALGLGIIMLGNPIGHALALDERFQTCRVKLRLFLGLGLRFRHPLNIVYWLFPEIHKNRILFGACGREYVNF